MRYYLIDNENNEHVIDITNTKRITPQLIEFKFYSKEGTKLNNGKTIFIRQLAGEYFASEDRKKWNKIPLEELPQKILNIDTVLDCYRGYKPSGIRASEEGDLVTHMPGLVVKISVKKGDKVKKGEPVIVLEAMKMENEIRSSMDGTVKEIHVKEGESLNQGKLMMELEAN